MQEFQVSDAFSSGPYKVEILSGNGQRRFDIKDETYSPPTPPTTAAPPSFVLDDEIIFFCPNETANATVKPITTAAPGLCLVRLSFTKYLSYYTRSHRSIGVFR